MKTNTYTFYNLCKSLPLFAMLKFVCAPDVGMHCSNECV